MFRKRVKKSYPPGTFIPTPARICAILQLCIAFTMILWYVSQPFVGEIFTTKSRLLFYQDVMGIPSHDNLSPDKLARLARNAERFHALPLAQQSQLKEQYDFIEQQLQRSFWSKLVSIVNIFVYQLSLYEPLWLVLSLIIPILLLKRIEGAAQAVWLLPLLAALYAADNRWHGHPAAPSAESRLFPSELQLIQEYSTGTLSANVLEQQTQLMDAWNRYLIIDWAKQTPSTNPTTFIQQAEEGEFAFTLARIERRWEIAPSKHETQQPLALLALYFFWNAYFAYTAWKHTRRELSY